MPGLQLLADQSLFLRPRPLLLVFLSSVVLVSLSTKLPTQYLGGSVAVGGLAAAPVYGGSSGFLLFV